MQRIVIWATATLVLTAFLISYQISLSGDGKSGDGPDQANAALCDPSDGADSKEETNGIQSEDDEKDEVETGDLHNGPGGQDCPSTSTPQEGSALPGIVPTSLGTSVSMEADAGSPIATVTVMETFRPVDPAKGSRPPDDVRPTKESA